MTSHYSYYKYYFALGGRGGGALSLSPVDSKSLSIIAGTECLPCCLLFPFGGKGSKFLPDGSLGGRGIEFFMDVSDFKFGGVLLLGGKGSGLSIGCFGGNGGG